MTCHYSPLSKNALVNIIENSMPVIQSSAKDRVGREWKFNNHPYSALNFHSVNDCPFCKQFQPSLIHVNIIFYDGRVWNANVSENTATSLLDFFCSTKAGAFRFTDSEKTTYALRLSDVRTITVSELK